MKMMALRKSIFDLIINNIPINQLKILYLSTLYKWEIGENTRIWNGIKIDGNTYGKVRIGNNCEIVRGCFFNTSWDGRIIIGNNVVFGHDVSLYGVDHDPADPAFSVRSGDIIIEDNCWIASKASILKDVVIGSNSVVAYGSIVTKNIPPNMIVGGVPAKVIKQRFNEKI